MSFKKLFVLLSSLFIIVVGSILYLPVPAFAETELSLPFTNPDLEFPSAAGNDSSVPILTDFISSLDYGDPDQIVGVYAPGTFALPIVQQPEGNPGFVSSSAEVATQFGLAEDYGSLGFLAHNTLSGAHFFDLRSGQTILVIYGDGSISSFLVAENLSYQALTPNSPYSRFRDLDQQNDELSSTDLFNRVYAEEGQVVFQTCIAANGNVNWGRYFVIAVPLGQLSVEGLFF